MEKTISRLVGGSCWLIAENDKVVTHYKSTGTYSGTYEDIDSTNEKVEI